MKSLIIEDAVAGDLAQIVEVYNQTIAGRMVTADLEPVTVQDRMNWFEMHSSESRPIWVIRKDDDIAGWLSFQSFYGRPAYHATAEISIYISYDHQAKGYGSLLLQKAIKACPHLGIETLLGFVFAHNKPSLKLLHKFAFEDWGYLPKVAQLDDVKRDLVILGKKIEN